MDHFNVRTVVKASGSLKPRTRVHHNQLPTRVFAIVAVCACSGDSFRDFIEGTPAESTTCTSSTTATATTTGGRGYCCCFKGGWWWLPHGIFTIELLLVSAFMGQKLALNFNDVVCSKSAPRVSHCRVVSHRWSCVVHTDGWRDVWMEWIV